MTLLHCVSKLGHTGNSNEGQRVQLPIISTQHLEEGAVEVQVSWGPLSRLAAFCQPSGYEFSFLGCGVYGPRSNGQSGCSTDVRFTRTSHYTGWQLLAHHPPWGSYEAVNSHNEAKQEWEADIPDAGIQDTLFSDVSCV